MPLSRDEVHRRRLLFLAWSHGDASEDPVMVAEGLHRVPAAVCDDLFSYRPRHDRFRCDDAAGEVRCGVSPEPSSVFATPIFREEFLYDCCVRRIREGPA